MSRRDEMDNILKQVEGWSPTDRVSLAQAIIELSPAEPTGMKPSLNELVGVGRGTGPAPSDEQIKGWIEEQRLRKYG